MLTSLSLRIDISRHHPGTGPRVLIFNQQGRTEAIDFLDSLCNTAKAADGVGFQRVIFCTNVTYAEAGYKRGTKSTGSLKPLIPRTRRLLTLTVMLDFVNHQNDPKDIERLTVQQAFAEKWRLLDPSANITAVYSIEEALNAARTSRSGLGKGRPCKRW